MKTCNHLLYTYAYGFSHGFIPNSVVIYRFDIWLMIILSIFTLSFAEFITVISISKEQTGNETYMTK